MQHMAIFVAWADGARTRPVVYEELSTGHIAERRVWDASYANTFLPIRYNGLVPLRAQFQSINRGSQPPI
jgi:hypothetical protein